MISNKENIKVQDTSSIIYVNFKARQTKSSSDGHAPEQIRSLFAPRFGAEFTEWFIDQYKKLEA